MCGRIGHTPWNESGAGRQVSGVRSQASGNCQFAISTPHSARRSTLYPLPSTVYRLPSTTYRLPSTTYLLPLIVSKNFVPIDRGQRAIHRKGDRVADPPHRAGGHGEIQAARMLAAKRPGVLPVAGRIFRVVRRNGAGSVSVVGVGPRDPVVFVRHVLSQQERAAGAIANLGNQPRVLIVAAEHHAIPVIEPVVGAVGSFVAPVGGDLHVDGLGVVVAPVGAAHRLVGGRPDGQAEQVARVDARAVGARRRAKKDRNLLAGGNTVGQRGVSHVAQLVDVFPLQERQDLRF